MYSMPWICAIFLGKSQKLQLLNYWCPIKKILLFLTFLIFMHRILHIIHPKKRWPSFLKRPRSLEENNSVFCGKDGRPYIYA